ncbi:MAG: hypothetical protein LBT40_03205 [Deltaproteobacteria bacterium]|nr:hypothetical protein [Deltaproteobacteria bacterium]
MGNGADAEIGVFGFENACISVLVSVSVPISVSVSADIPVPFHMPVPVALSYVSIVLAGLNLLEVEISFQPFDGRQAQQSV